MNNYRFARRLNRIGLCKFVKKKKRGNGKGYLSISMFCRLPNRVHRSIKSHFSVDLMAVQWESVPRLPIRKYCSSCSKSATRVNHRHRHIRNNNNNNNSKNNRNDEIIPSIRTEWNLNAISGLTRSKKWVIFLPIRSGNITINEFPILLTIMSDLKKKKKWKRRKLDYRGEGKVINL